MSHKAEDQEAWLQEGPRIPFSSWLFLLSRSMQPASSEELVKNEDSAAVYLTHGGQTHCVLRSSLGGTGAGWLMVAAFQWDHRLGSPRAPCWPRGSQTCREKQDTTQSQGVWTPVFCLVLLPERWGVRWADHAELHPVSSEPPDRAVSSSRMGSFPPLWKLWWGEGGGRRWSGKHYQSQSAQGLPPTSCISPQSLLSPASWEAACTQPPGIQACYFLLEVGG